MRAAARWRAVFHGVVVASRRRAARLSLCAAASLAGAFSPADAGAASPSPAPLAKYALTQTFGVLQDILPDGDGGYLAIGERGLVLQGRADGTTTRARSVSDRDLAGVARAGSSPVLWIVGEHGVVMTSTNGGGAWAAVDLGLPAPDLLSVSVSDDGQDLWIGGKEGFLARSTDAGLHWTRIELGSRASLNALQRLTRSGRLVVAGSDGFLATVPTTGLPLPERRFCGAVRTFFAIAASPDETETAVVGEFGTACRSRDGGLHWTAWSDTDHDDDLWAVVYDPAGGRFVAVGQNGAVYRSTPAGWDYVLVQWLADGLHGLILAPGGRLLACGSGGILVASADSGQTWRGLPGRPDRGAIVDVATSRNGRVVAAVGGNILLRSVDGGARFESEPVDGGQPRSVAVSGDGARTYVALETGLILGKSHGPRARWEKVAQAPGKVVGLEAGTGGDDVLFATRDGRIFRSAPGGGDPVRLFSNGHDLAALAASPDGRRFAAGGVDGAFAISVDEGRTWSAPPVEDGRDIASLALAPNGTVWAGAAKGVVMRSTDDGRTWKATSIDGAAGAIGAIAAVDSTVWIADGSGRVGQSWDRMMSVSWHFSLRDAVTVLWAVPDGRTLWYGSTAHDLGRFEPTATRYPTVSAQLPARLERGAVNAVTLAVAPSPACPVRGMEFLVDIAAPGLASTRLKLSPARWLADDRVEVAFELPRSVPDRELTLTLFTSCPGFMVGYVFEHLATRAWLDRVPGGVPTLATAGALLLLPLLSLLLYAARPAALVGLREVMRHDALPGWLRAVSVPLDQVLLTGWLCRRPRVLDAWVRSRRAAFESRWVVSVFMRGTPSYLPLPVRISPGSGNRRVVEEPAVADLREALGPGDTVIQVVGVGGIGKTMLARQCARSLLDGSLLGHVALPLPVATAGDDIPGAARAAIAYLLGDAGPQDVLVRDLLRAGRLVPVFDRVSEVGPIARAQVAAFCNGCRLAVMTARVPQPVDGETLLLEPQFIVSGAVLTRYVEHEFVRLGIAEGPRRLAQTLAVTTRLVQLMEDAADDREPGQITPLLATAFAVVAAEGMGQDARPGGMPTSVARTFLAHVRELHQRGETSFAGLSATRYMDAAAALAGMALAGLQGPQELDRAALEAHLEGLPATAGVSSRHVLDGFVETGLLARRDTGIGCHLRFAIDSYAEVLGALWLRSPAGSHSGLEARMRAAMSAGQASPSVLQTLRFVDELAPAC